MGLTDVAGVGRCSCHVVNQATVHVDADMGFHAEVPLIAFARLMHLWIALPFFVLCGTGGIDDRRVDQRSLPEHEAFVS